ncbi:MAG: tRNA (N(6)-L-threonylcarbamoyladenosine(37)-C(2))-methylthiotransferase MtaB [Erysipelotrichaceae bacterium]|jgi:threonylcarbamoyladenosine tRNA methylthiotransferase MtaB|nr:tRNA (N(6)-L-threonylcarbamoyladenosine(37)-C(2))-methylthiotransferase MtaB [Erysipelotrichaceae bacterium]
MNRSFFTHTLGCKVNAYESEALATELIAKGWHRADKDEIPGLIVLNTCSVTGKADQKSRQHISSFRKRYPDAVLLVMGCYSQTHEQEAAGLGADIVLGASKRALAAGYIDSFLETGVKIIDVKSNLRHEKYEALSSISLTDKTRAYLKIQDGCDNFCSYCFIPQLRGNSRSRDPREVVEEAKALVEAGNKEIVLTGIHIGGYGKDLADGSFRLSDLIASILNKVPNLWSLRISSIEESEIDDRLLSLLATQKRIANHLHIPLQSGSSSVLQRMKRHYDTEAFLKKLDAIRAVRPDIAITTDVIAGFPLESEEEWAETLSFCEKANFAEIHVFPFSSRPKTYAATLPDTKPEIKKRRVAELLALSKKQRRAYEEKFYGKELEVLIEEIDEGRGIAKGHTSNYFLVSVPAGGLQKGDITKIVYESSIASD